ncbi:hypothetical protein LY76DRAFT_72467 [Colletotrichum caudatum]|nr:hypothetical protein LY76DRAFT_72467 [Colletotrichum caudatum]
MEAHVHRRGQPRPRLGILEPELEINSEFGCQPPCPPLKTPRTLFRNEGSSFLPEQLRESNTNAKSLVLLSGRIRSRQLNDSLTVPY